MGACGCSQPISSIRADAVVVKKPVSFQGEERDLCPYVFEGGRYVKIVIGGDVDTEVALKILEEQIKLKRMELQGKSQAQTPPETVNENE